MLKCSTSLWFANLGQLTREIERIQPYTDRFHLEVADGHYTPALMFSPDLVRAVRGATKLPLEVHLMVTDPEAWIDPFIEAGADAVIFEIDTAKEPGRLVEKIKAKGKMAGIGISLNHSVDEVQALWKDLDILSIAGTAPGDEKTTFASACVDKIHGARETIFTKRWKTALEAEGGIVEQSVPLLKAAGVDYLVLGKAVFETPKKVRQWLGEPAA